MTFPNQGSVACWIRLIPWWEDDLITSVNQNPSVYQVNKTTVAWFHSLNKSPNLRFSKTFAIEVNYKSKQKQRKFKKHDCIHPSSSLWRRLIYLKNILEWQSTILGTGDAAVDKTKFLLLWSCNSSVNSNILRGLNAPFMWLFPPTY